MNITEVVSFDKDGHIEHFSWFKKLFLGLVIVLVAGLSFGIGRLTGVGKSEPIRIEYDSAMTNDQTPMTKQVSNPKPQTTSTSVYASSKGKKYYYANCSGLSRILATNKVGFASAAAAEAAGLTLASNCNP